MAWECKYCGGDDFKKRKIVSAYFNEDEELDEGFETDEGEIICVSCGEEVSVGAGIAELAEWVKEED